MPISRVFPATHPRAGEATHFEYKIRKALGVSCAGRNCKHKIHTCRSNYQLWKKRIDEVNAGNAVLVLYEWTGNPYRSKTRELFRFDKNSGIGVQELDMTELENKYISEANIVDNRAVYADFETISDNDGLSLKDFREWFKNYNLSKPMAIIHFTLFRY